MFLPASAAATVERGARARLAPPAGRRRAPGERHRGAGANRLDVEAEDRGGQQSHIGQAE
jgi:hypothetical protein